MLREESTTKGQQSFTISFRRDKLAVIFSRITSSQGTWAEGGWAPGQARDAPAWICSLRFQETAFPDQPRVTVAPSDFQTQEGIVASMPAVASAIPRTCSLLPT